MKKVLLALVMIYALPISSLKAEWSDYLPSWKQEASAETKQTYLDSANKWALRTVLAVNSAFLSAVLFAALIVIIDGPNTDLNIRNTNHPFILAGPLVGQLASQVSIFPCAVKAGYDWLQAQRIQTNHDES